MIDYVQISADIGERVIEFADHLHEHFVDPCDIQDGAYQVPRQPGFSVKMHDESLNRFEYPNGPEWRDRINKKIA
jgi:L-fuconate dehydratase